jgi:UDP-GlcNAc:undecaprenyl-phosphate GlcNAc-1-phosphate transferase
MGSEFLSNIYMMASFSLIGSFFITLYLIPKIIWVVNSNDLIDKPDDRSAHKNSTPTMGGFAFFLTLVFSIFFIKIWDVEAVGLNFIAAITLIFAVGLKDDLVLTSPRAKLVSEVIAILFILFLNGFQVNSLEGFLGINNISPWLSYSLIVLLILTIINAYNLIDGIDGLASVIGIVVFSFYGLIFFVAGLYFYFLVSLILIGILSAFLRFNFSSSQKIFMGDTGSLIIGFCMGFLSLKFLAMDSLLLSEYSFVAENKLIIIGGILFIPLFDTFRVIGIRLLNNKSPFYPDRNHIHHILIDLEYSHIKASLFLGFLNLILIDLLSILSLYFNSYQMFGFLIVVFILMLGLFYKLKSSVKKKE